jgi:hypothetical protein
LFVAQLRALDEKYRGDFGVRLGNTVIDTVAACFGMKDEDDNAEATKICNIMRRIFEEGRLCNVTGSSLWQKPRKRPSWRICLER